MHAPEPAVVVDAALQRLAAVLAANDGNRITPALAHGLCAQLEAQLRQAFPPVAPADGPLSPAL